MDRLICRGTLISRSKPVSRSTRICSAEAFSAVWPGPVRERGFLSD